MATTTIIIIGYDCERNREENKPFPVAISVPDPGGCPTCKSARVYEYAGAVGVMYQYPSANLPKKASEFYRLEAESAQVAHDWINSPGEASWLNDPCKVILVYDPDLVNSEPPRARTSAASSKKPKAPAKRPSR